MLEIFEDPATILLGKLEGPSDKAAIKMGEPAKEGKSERQEVGFCRLLLAPMETLHCQHLQTGHHCFLYLIPEGMDQIHPTSPER